MSTTVDSRVVEMQFDNRNFEENVQTSLSTLEKLKQSLNLDGAAKGFESIDTAARNVNMGGLGDAVEAVKLKFSALQVMGITALSNITNQAVNTGKRIVSALTIDPIKTGFSEYETKINAIQTIMSNTASKGTTMADVTRVIGELNEYADKTIYNFAEMTRNIGTFTAAGVGLEDSAAAIQGIANLAAASGSTSQQASTAMYQLSQALSTGTVRLMDWNSVVNAGMGGEKFQNALKDTAREYGVAIDDIIEENGSFRESLSEGWLSADILNTTLRKFTVEGAKEYSKSMIESGKWTQKQADALMKEAQAMEDAATKVKTFTQLWDTLKESAQSGWGQTWEIIIGDFEEAKETLTEISKVVGGVIEASAKARNELLQGWKDAGGRADLVDSLFNIIKGIGTIIAPIKEAFQEVFPPLTVETLKKFTSGLKELTSKFKLSDTVSKNLKDTFKGLFAIVDLARHIVVEIFSAVGRLTGSFGELGGGILGITGALGRWVSQLVNAIEKSGIFKMVLGGVAETIKFLFNGLKSIAGFIAGTFSFVGDAVSGAGKATVGAVDAMGNALKDSSFLSLIEGLWEGVKVLGKGLFGALEKVGKGLNAAGIDSIFDLLHTIVAGGLGVALIGLIRSFTNAFDNFTLSTNGVAGIFEEVGGVLEGYQSKLKADALIKIAAAIAILVGAIAVLSTIDSKKLALSVAAIYALFAGLMLSFNIVNKSGKGMAKFMKTSTFMIAMAGSVLILAMALKTISGLNFADMAQGILGVAALMGTMVVMAKTLSTGTTLIIKGAGQMLIVAGALTVLAASLRIIAELNWNELGVGLVGMAGAVAMLVTVALVLTKWGQMDQREIDGAFDLVLIAGALLIVASALKMVASVGWEGLAIGLIGVGAVVGAMIGLVKVLEKQKGDKMIEGAGKVLVMSMALMVMAGALTLISTVDWGGLAKGIIGLAAAAGIIVGLSFALAHVGDQIVKGSGAMILMAVAMTTIATSLLLFEHVSWDTVIKGILTLAAVGGIMVGLGAAMTALAGIIPAMFALAGATALMGLSIAVVATSMAMLGIGIASIGFAIAFVLSEMVEFVSFATNKAGEIVEAIITTFEGIALGIVHFAELMSEGMPIIGDAVKSFVFVICDVVEECIPEIVRTFLYTVDEILAALAEYAPSIVSKILQLLTKIIDAVADGVPALSKSIGRLVSALVEGIVDAMGSLHPADLAKAVAVVGMIVAMIYPLAFMSPQLLGKAMIGLIGVGAFIAELALILAAIGGLAQISGLNWLINEGGTLLQSIGRAIGGLVGGVMGGIAEGATSSMPKVGSHLSGFMENAKPFFDGLKGIDSSVLKGVKTVAEAILMFTAAGLMDRMMRWATGRSSITKFGTDMVILGKCIKKFSTTVSGINTSAISAAASAGSELAEMSERIPKFGGIVQMWNGISDPASFGTSLKYLGKGLVSFSESAEGLNINAISDATEAAKALAEMSDCIPKMGGFTQLWEGVSDPAAFGISLGWLGAGLSDFSSHVEDLNINAITDATEAAVLLASMSEDIPKMGGIVDFFSGASDPATFGMSLTWLGAGLSDFSSSVHLLDIEGMNKAIEVAESLAKMSALIPDVGGYSDPATFGNTLGGLGSGLVNFSSHVGDGKLDIEAMKSATEAAKVLAEMCVYIPKMGGITQLWEGSSDPAAFGRSLGWLGGGLKDFSGHVDGLNIEAMKSATEAAKALAEMSVYIPKMGGIKGLWEGYADPANFGLTLGYLGGGLKDFSGHVDDLNIKAMESATEAAKALAEMSVYIPKMGGIKSLWEGSSGPGAFGDSLYWLGKGLAGFSTAVSVDGFDPENIKAAAAAAQALAQMCSYIPETGGMQAWFTGDKSVAKFGSELGALGRGLADFSTEVSAEGFDPENIKAAGVAAKALAEMCSYIPETGGVQAWLSGDESIAKFGSELGELGKGLADFSAAVSVDGFSAENIQVAANAAKALAEMCSYIPSQSGLQAWFGKDDSVTTFADNLPKLGEGLAGFSSAIAIDGFNPENIKAAATAAKSLAEMTATAPKDSSKLISFGENLVTFSGSLATYFTATAGITPESITASNDAITAVKTISSLDSKGLKSTADAIDDVVRAIKGMGSVNASHTNGFVKAVEKLAETNIDAFAKKFKDLKKEIADIGKEIVESFSKGVNSASDTLTNAGKTAVKNFSSGITDNEKIATKAWASLIVSCVSTIEDEQSEFESAGKYLVSGFANGISENTFAAKAKAKAMAAAAAKAAADELDEHSPSKVGYGIGAFFGMGFVNAIGDYADKSYKVGVEMAGSARDGLNSAIGKINDIVANDLDTQPTIRPVLDLSNVKSGANAISSIFGNGASVGVMANVGAISSAMNRRGQNGVNDAVVEAIDKLRGDLGKVGNTSYTIEGITYDESSSVASAIEAITRAAINERRI